MKDSISAVHGKTASPHRNAVDMFTVNRQIRRSDLSYAAQALLCAILEHDRYGQSERGCLASLDTLAAEIGATRQYVTTLLPQLLKGRWVTSERDGKHRPLRLGPRIREALCTPQQSLLGAECTPQQSSLAPSNDCTCTPQQSLPVSILEVREETEFAGGLSRPGRKTNPDPGSCRSQASPLRPCLNPPSPCGTRSRPDGKPRSPSWSATSLALAGLSGPTDSRCLVVPVARGTAIRCRAGCGTTSPTTRPGSPRQEVRRES